MNPNFTIFFKQKRVNRFIGSLILAGILLFLFQRPLPVRGQEAEPEYEPRALIQTTSFQSDFEGLLYFDLMETVLLEEGDSLLAFDNVKNTFTGIYMDGYNASGNIFDITEQELIVVSNRHVLQYWTEDSYLVLSNGYMVRGEPIYLSDHMDVGFVRVPIDQLTYEELSGMRCVRKSMEHYRELEPEQTFFTADITGDVGHPEMHQGAIINTDYYVPGLDAHMIYARSYARSGMSGSGLFNEKGAYLGMLTAGTVDQEIAGVGLPDILEAYAAAGLESSGPNQK